MTTTISRLRETRSGTSRVRVRVPDDSTAPKRRRLKQNDSSGEVATPARSRATRARTREADEPRPERKTRSRPRAPIGAAESGRTGIASTLANTTIRPRNRARGPGAGKRSREVTKLARIRDGRYSRARSRFVV